MTNAAKNSFQSLVKVCCCCFFLSSVWGSFSLSHEPNQRTWICFDSFYISVMWQCIRCYSHALVKQIFRCCWIESVFQSGFSPFRWQSLAISFSRRLYAMGSCYFIRSRYDIIYAKFVCESNILASTLINQFYNIIAKRNEREKKKKRQAKYFIFIVYSALGIIIYLLCSTLLPYREPRRYDSIRVFDVLCGLCIFICAICTYQWRFPRNTGSGNLQHTPIVLSNCSLLR